MSSLIKIGIKDKKGNYVNYMVSIQNEVDLYGNNVSMYLEQTKEEREAKAKRTYVGNGRVVWTDGEIQVAPNPNAPEGAGVDIAVSAESDNANTTSVLDDLKNTTDGQKSPKDYIRDEAKDDLPF